jgi:hypothetical protein
MYIGTSSDIWRRPLSDFSIAVRKLKLAIIAQNGFKTALSGGSRSYLSILLSFFHREHVAISINNLSGAFIRTLANRHFMKGAHTFSLDTRAMAAGLYLVKIKARSKCSAGIFAHVR